MAATLANVILDVADLERSLAFYAGCLGLPVEGRVDDGDDSVVYLRTGITELLLVRQNPDDRQTRGKDPAGVLLKFYVNNLAEIQTRALLSGLGVTNMPHDPGCDERSVLVCDPDGYSVILAQPGPGGPC
jgi:catechol 2,3-dioxygenase-like lactoylglutathione lyase family enzyme